MTSRDSETLSDDETSAEVISLNLPSDAEPSGVRVKRLQHELRVLARAQLEAFAGDLGAMAESATEIVNGGDAFDVGARELAARLAEDLRHKSQTLLAIAGRSA